MMGYCGVLNVAIDHVRGFNGAPHQVIFILVLSTATPQVDYRERLVAVGQLPSRADRRDPGGTEREVLGARLVDRALRPLLPPGWAAPTQVGGGGGGGAEVEVCMGQGLVIPPHAQFRAVLLPAPC
jgi:hypothetical protein